MPIKYKYDSGKNVVYTYGIGEVSYAELQEYFQTILNDPDIKNNFWEIVNTSDVFNVTITFSDCIELLSLIKRFVKEKNYKGAILYSPNKTSISVIKLLFSVLRKFTSGKFFIANNLDSFQMLALQHLDITYEFDTWHEDKNT